MNTLLTQIVEKLDSLEQEKEDLAEYQKFDREKRAFEYLILENQKREAEQKLKKLKNQREQKREAKTEIREKSETLRKQLEEAKKNLSDVDHKLARAMDEKEAASAEKEKLISSKTKYELEIKELKLSVNEDNQTTKNAEEELRELKIKIREKRHELEQQLTPEFQRLKALEDGLFREKQGLERKKEELYAKQGRNTRFMDQQSRDSWIRQEISQLETQISAREHDLKREQEVSHGSGIFLIWSFPVHFRPSPRKLRTRQCDFPVPPRAGNAQVQVGRTKRRAPQNQAQKRRNRE